VIDLSAPAPRLVRFGVFELDLRSGDLRKDGARTRLNLPNQQLQFLTALLERPGELITRDELRQRLWAEETFVDFEHGLNATVKRVRYTLGDSADKPRFIETVPRRGYRFIAPVSRDNPPSASVPLPAQRPERQGADDATPFNSQLSGPSVQPLASTDVLPTTSGDHTPIPPQEVVGRVARHPGITVAATVAVALLIIGGWWTMRSLTTRMAAPSAQVPRHLTRLTFDPGLQTDVTWSPDGRFIAYASDRAGTFNIWVQPVSGGDAVQITKSQGQDTEPDWSPDGSTIVFRSERDGGGLFVVPSLGGTERRLTSFGVQPKWSPNGSQILFASGPDILSRATYVVALDNSPPHPILEGFVNDDLLYVLCRAWHPDGRVSIVARTRNEGFGLYTFPVSGGRPTLTRILQAARVIPGTARDVPHVEQCQWAPSGAALYFEGKLNDVSNVWRVAIDPKSLEAGVAERLTTGSGQDARVAVSRDGQYAAFATQAESTRLWSFLFDAAVGGILGDGQPVTATTTLVQDTELAPDGRRIAYSLTGVGTGVSELWTQDLMSGEKRQLARDSANRNAPKWAPDGSRLAYQWHHRTDTTQEYSVGVRPATGGDERLLSSPLSNHQVVPFGWSPDGKSVLVSASLSTSGEPRMVAYSRFAVTLWSLAAAPHADQSARVLASSPEADLWQESFSPSGRWIVFEAVNRRVPDATATLYVIPSAGADSTHWTRLTDRQGWADKPRWSPDGKRLYFWSRQGSLFNVWGVRFDDEQGTTVGAPFQVTRFDGRARQIYGGDPSVSRTRLLLSITDTTGSIWMLDKMDK
jgi:Tol biopolymer transport system component/DNA-binding winged helix-turn-helix (wHTH) protein